MDFHDVEDDVGYVIPKGTIVKVRMQIRKGGCDHNKEVGNTNGYATEGSNTGSVYLDCKFTVVEGEYKGREFFDLIGLYSNKGPKWADMGRVKIKGILASARRIDSSDKSESTKKAFSIDNYGDLDGLVFLTSVRIEEDGEGNYRNKMLKPITPKHPDYANLMGTTFNTDNTVFKNPEYRQNDSSSLNDDFLEDDEIPFC